MQSMQYEDLTGQNLVEKGDDFVLSGLRYIGDNF